MSHPENSIAGQIYQGSPGTKKAFFFGYLPLLVVLSVYSACLVIGVVSKHTGTGLFLTGLILFALSYEFKTTLTLPSGEKVRTSRAILTGPYRAALWYVLFVVTLLNLLMEGRIFDTAMMAALVALVSGNKYVMRYFAARAKAADEKVRLAKLAKDAGHGVTDVEFRDAE